MTSKEILAVIKGAFVSMNKDCEEQFNQIEHDLEVLEILKKYITELNKWAYYDEKTNSITTLKIISMIDLKPENKDYKTIKEWLDK